MVAAGHESKDEGNAGAVSKKEKDFKQWPHQSAEPGTLKHDVVSFYFTNVPDNISYYSLRLGFEVCGIMEDVYLARKRNVNGANFGFVRYSNVKDVDKLLKAVNNVWFGDYKVVAKVSSYDRYGNKREDEGRKAVGVKTIEGEKKSVVLLERKHVVGGENITEGEKSKAAGLEAGEGGSVRLKGGGVVSTDLVRKMAIGDRGFRHVTQTEQRYVPKYTSLASDMEWASNGMVVSVLNGDAIPVLQRRIYDAEFEKLVLIPMGANTVFLKTLDNLLNGNVSTYSMGM